LTRPGAAQEAFASFASTLRPEALPDDVREKAKTLLLDTLATMVGGSGAPGVAQVLAQLQEWGGTAQSTIAVFGGKLPAPAAAMINAVMAHALDFDDTYDETGLHANVCVVPALLAVAEAKGHVSGAELVAAHAVGLEISSRLALAAGSRIAPGWLPTTLFGCFGATAAAGRIMGLSQEQLKHALGIVYNSAGGNRQGLLDGALTKRIQPALYAQAAVTAAALAKRGVTGPDRAFDGKYGLFPLFVQEGYDLATLTGDLGDRFAFLGIGIKPYPCCRGNHPSIDAALELAGGHSIDPSDIRAVTVYLANQGVADLVGQPFQLRRNPQVDAQFSVRYTVAAALSRGRLGLADFDESRIRDDRVTALANRIEVMVDPDRHGTVHLLLCNGETLSARSEHASGHPMKPLTRDALFGKLADCVERAAWPLPPGCAEDLQRRIERVEHTDDVSGLLSATVGTRGV
jgi:2-methylcitrate dehydratase PrpD